MSEHSEQDIIIDGNVPSSPTTTTTTPVKVSLDMDEYKDMDEIDTDDLLDEAEITLKQPKKTTTKRKTKTTTTTTRRNSRKSSTTTTTTTTTATTGTEKRKSTRKGKQVILPPPEDLEQLASINNNNYKKQKKAAAIVPEYNLERCQELSLAHPDSFWQFHADSGYNMINTINETSLLEPVPTNMSDQAAITSMTLSSDGTLLATFSNIGAVKIWDIENDFKLVRKLRDIEEENIDEFYCGKFASDTQELLVTGGKLKDRHRWSSQDEDNHILPCPIKIFSIAENKVLSKLEGHAEEILCIKTVKFDNGNYYISTSQDGYIRKWHVEDDWTTLIDSTAMADGVTCMAFTVSFLPNTGNKYFMAACDESLRLYDFEEAQLLRTFDEMYSSYCDCGKFITWLDEPKKEDVEEEDKMDQDNDVPPYSYFISRGAEMCDVDEGVSSIPNTCILHKLVYPTKTGGQFQLETVKKFKHDDYHANSWLVKITSNGRYILAPTIYGQIFVFNILTGQLSAILKEHEDLEVRDVIFHPYRPLIFSSGDDGFVKVYSYKNEDTEVDLDVGMST